MTPFRYLAPETVQEAVAVVEPFGPAGEGGAFLAGGTTVLDLMKLNVLSPPSLTDIRHLGLDRIELAEDGETVHVGARVTMADAADHPVFRERAPVLSQALRLAASPQLRNMATLAGNVLQRTRCPYFRDNVSPCNKRDPGSGCSAIGGVNRLLAVLGTSDDCIASYPGDFANALILFDTAVETALPGGECRRISLPLLHTEPRTTPERETILGDAELITGFEIRLPSWAQRSLYLKVRDRSSYAFALASAAVALDMEGKTVRKARIALGGVATIPWRAHNAEALLVGRTLDEETAMEAGETAFQTATAYGQNAFKIPLGQRTVAKALLDAAALDVDAGGAG